MNDYDLGRQDACPPSGSPSDIPGNPYYGKDEAKFVTVGHLPHISECQKIYAVTFRLHDSLPHAVIKAYMEECENAYGKDTPSFKTKREAMLHKKMMNFLDAGHGECLLKNKNARRIVEEAFEYVENNMGRVHAYVIMPNHVHVLLETIGDTNIQQVMHSIKSYSALKINKLTQHEGRVWQREYFDRIIRNDAHYANAINYIINNPRHCKPDEYTLGGTLGGQASCLPKDET